MDKIFLVENKWSMYTELMNYLFIEMSDTLLGVAKMKWVRNYQNILLSKRGVC